MMQSLNKTAARTVELLEYLSKCDKGVGISEISRELQLPKSSASDILYTLLYTDFIQYDSEELKTFKLGLKSLKIGLSAVGKLSIIDTAKKALETLNENTHMTVYLAIENNSQVIYIDKIEKNVPYRLSSDIGAVKSMHMTAAGKAILAAHSDREIGLMAGEGCYAVNTENSISNYNSLMFDIMNIRKQGYAVENFEENEYTYALAAPIYDINDMICAAVSVSMISTDYEKTDLAALAVEVMSTAAEISSAYGSRKIKPY